MNAPAPPPAPASKPSGAFQKEQYDSFQTVSSSFLCRTDGFDKRQLRLPVNYEWKIARSEKKFLILCQSNGARLLILTLIMKSQSKIFTIVIISFTNLVTLWLELARIQSLKVTLSQKCPSFRLPVFQGRVSGAAA